MSASGEIVVTSMFASAASDARLLQVPLALQAQSMDVMKISSILRSRQKLRHRIKKSPRNV
ncbi:MAG: hypothetical protein Q6353_007230 [Candidatus Sigynarchaeum springense]